MEQKVDEIKQKLIVEQQKAVDEEVELVDNEVVPKKKLYDVVCNIIIKYKDVFGLQKLARLIHMRRVKQLKEKERLAEKSFHSGGGSFKQHSYKFFSSNTKHKTKSDNVSFNSKSSFKFFSNSQKLKTKSDSKLGTQILSRRHSQIEGIGVRGSVLADFKQYMEAENKKKEEKARNLEQFNKRTKKIEQVPVGIVNGRMMNFLSSELQELNDYEKKITHNNNKEKPSFRSNFFYIFLI